MTDRAGSERVIEGEFVEARPGRSGLRLLPWVLLLLIAVFILGLYAAPAIEARLARLGWIAARAPASGEVTALSAEITRLGEGRQSLLSRVATLEAALVALDEESAANRERTLRIDPSLDSLPITELPEGATERIEQFKALGDRIAVLEKQLADRDAGRSPADGGGIDALGQQLLRLDNRLSAIEADGSTSKTGLPGSLAAALLALDRRILAGRPYAEALAALESGLAGLPTPPADVAAPLRILHARSASGVATLADLRAGFRLAAAAMQRAEPVPANTGLLARLRQGLSGLIAIRRVDERQGPVAMLNEAEQALEAGDVAASLAALDGLTAGTREAAADWIGAAKARQAALEALEAISGALTGMDG